MRFSYSWLKELTNTTLSPHEAADRLTMLGLEVESLVETKPAFKGVVVGKVLDAQKIEGSDNLKVCKVTTGEQDLQIVCGAPNIEMGQKVPIAVVGAELPGGLKIKSAKLRGVTSQGMICSEAELGLSNDASGIMVLDGDFSIGTNFEQALHDRHDTIIELSITPNRPDCLGMNGIARELCVGEGRSFHPHYPKIEEPLRTSETYPIVIRNVEACPRYTGRIIRNVCIGKSPDWLIERLHHADVRSINNIVDITNYIMLATGQPLHAFDLDKLEHGVITVRNADEDELFTTLDGKEHKLLEDDLLICDGSLPVALAGVMGGENSEVGATTKNILLESAYFSPVSVRKTAKRLGISTEASKRFEKGIDPNGCDLASDAATQLIFEYAKGEVVSKLLDEYPKRIKEQTITFRPSRANLIIGEQISQQATQLILTNLGCEVVIENGNWDVSVPTFRPDLTREIDLIEEIARVFGYNNVAPTTVNAINLLTTREPEIDFIEKLKQHAVQATLTEVVTLSMIAEKQARLFLQDDERLVRLLNPLSEEMAILRPSLVSSILPVVAHNINRKQTDLRFFEVGSSFLHKSDDKKINETIKFASVMTGNQSIPSWETKPTEVTFFDLKGILETILKQLGIMEFRFLPFKESFICYGSTIKSGQQDIGYIGKLHPQILDQFDIEKDVFVFELEFEHLFALADTYAKKFVPYSHYPFVERDIAIVVEGGNPASTIIDCIKRAGGELLTNVHLFDLYAGKQIPANKKSLALSLKFQSSSSTLKDAEVDEAIKGILRTLKKDFQADLRQ